jgi:hypothetical protein
LTPNKFKALAEQAKKSPTTETTEENRKFSPSTLVIVALITVFAYGLLLPFTGFYWDDLPFAWIAKFLGAREFIPAFAPYRPFLGPIFYLTTRLIPPVPIYWQVFALIVRFTIGIAAWWSFKHIWRERPHLAWIAALLILIFPGYSQHWIAYTHINQELIPFIFYILSFGFTFKALYTRKTSHVTIALLLQVCGIFPTEYFFGIEGLRFLFLFFYFEGNFIERFTKALKIWIPYLLIWILNAAWLVYYYKFGAYHSYEVTATQSFTALTLLWEALDTLLKAGFYIWIQILPLIFSAPLAPASLLAFGLILVSLVLIIPQVKQPAHEYSKSFALSLIVIGIIGILLGRLPSLAAGLPFTLQSSYDRFMVSMMIGGTVFIIGVIEFLFKNQNTKTYIYAVLIAFGIGQQFFNANIFRRDWEKQRDIYWQMAWRIPALKPNTVILTHQMPIDYETDISFTAPINWMYAPNFKRGNLPYLMLYTEKRIGGPTLPSFEPNTPITFPYRTVSFYGNASQAIVIYMPQNGCLRALDPKRGDAEIYAKLPDVLTNAIPLSDTSNIIADTNTPATAEMFFPEPKHEWCYYFAKAELAQQISDRQKVVALGNEAVSLGYKPEDQNEWLVFIEAYALTGNLKTAEKISLSALKEDPRIKHGVCVIWERIQAQSADSSASIKMLKKMGCGN